MISSLLKFAKNPDYKHAGDLNLNEKFSIFFRLLALSLLVSLALALLIGLLEEVAGLELGRHAMDLLFEEYTPGFIFLVVVVLAPVLEELFFRGPLYLFRNSSYFGLIFYLFTLVFGFYHITNFELTPTILYLSPLLVSPQLFIGLLLGYIRIRLGLQWAILLHSAYNLALVGPLILFKVLEIQSQ